MTVVAPVVVAVSEPGVEVTEYLVIADPPVFDGAAHQIDA